MPTEPFTNFIIWKHPLSSLCFFSFGMSFLSLWVKKIPWLWGSFALIAYAIAFHIGIATGLSLIPILLLFLCHFLLKSEIKQWGRLFLFVIATLLSSGLSLHLLPGFNNWNLASQVIIGQASYPISLWFNFDKPFIGLIPLALSIPLIQSRAHLKACARITIPMTLVGVLLLMGIAMHVGIIAWDPKLPSIFPLFAFNQLIFVCIAEEAFFRGFFQKELSRWLGTGTWASVGAVLGTSIFFTLMHIRWIPSFPFLCLIFLASILYGMIYEITRAIESSIFCHLSLNLTHFLLFSYPML